MRKSNRQTVAGLLRRLFFKTTSISILFAATSILAIPLAVEAQVGPATYTVCPGVGVCDYESPDEAVNAAARVSGDIINIVTGTVPDTYVLGATLQVDNNMTINGNGSTLDANGNRAIEVFGTSTVVTVNGINIENAQAPVEESGGAIIVTEGARLNLNGVTVENS